MDTQAFIQAVLDAQAMVSAVEEPYRVAAFQVALSLILGSRVPIVEGIGYSEVATQRATPMSFEEFAARLPKTLTSHNDRFVAVAYYLDRHSQAQVFRANEIADEFYKRVHWPRPKNASDVANQCAKKGHYQLEGMDEKGVKCWRITRLGVEHIEKLLQGNSET